jgi:hypothetical protein
VSGLLVSLLTGDTHPASLSPRSWERLLRDARATMLSARLAMQASEQGWYDHIPIRPRRHLDAARLVCASQQHTMRAEIRHIERALSAIDAPIVLLKGAAYLMAGLPAAKGRIFSDVDIMVPREAVQDAEAALLGHGWMANVSEYDRHYYEAWMHELPALQHVQRASVIDLHHTVAPPVSRIPVDARKLFARTRPIAGTRFRILAPEDMLLHSALHLMQEGQFEHGLRDLVDLDSLFREFGTDPSFWAILVERARELGVTRPLYYVVQQTRALLGTPMPQDFLVVIDHLRPGFLTRRLMASLLGAALADTSGHDGSRFVAMARQFLYLRGHYMRMPLRLLVPHLVHKGAIRLTSIANGTTAQSIPVGEGTGQ